MLTEEEANALERCRLIDNGESAESVRGLEAWQKWTEDKQLLACAMLRLYPPGWNDPVTPGRLVELGGTRQQHQDYCSVTYENAQSMRFCFRGKQFWIDESYENRDFPECFVPRNMQEARQLLERCGAIKEKT